MTAGVACTAAVAGTVAGGITAGGTAGAADTAGGDFKDRDAAGREMTARFVRFGSEADICAAKTDVRFAPNSDRESGLPRTVMSALHPKADMCSALTHVRFGPKADIARAK